MLVLTRKLMERLYIGDSICVTVVRLEGGQVRLGIDAPKDVRVMRGELLDRDGAAGPPAAAPVRGVRAISPAARPERPARERDGRRFDPMRPSSIRRPATRPEV